MLDFSSSEGEPGVSFSAGKNQPMAPAGDPTIGQTVSVGPML